MCKLKMKQIQDGLKTDPEITTLLTRELKMKQIPDSLKAGPVIYFIIQVPYGPPDFYLTSFNSTTFFIITFLLSRPARHVTDNFYILTKFLHLNRFFSYAFFPMFFPITPTEIAGKKFGRKKVQTYDRSARIQTGAIWLTT